MDRIKEKIGYYKILVPLVWTGVFLASSGTCWMVMIEFPYKMFFIVLLIMFVIGLITGFLFLDKRIRKLIKEL